MTPGFETNPDFISSPERLKTKKSLINIIFSEEYGQYYGQMNTMNPNRMMTVKRDGLPYEEMAYCPPPNRKLPPVPGQHSNFNTIDRIKNGKNFFES